MRTELPLSWQVLHLKQHCDRAPCTFNDRATPCMIRTSVDCQTNKIMRITVLLRLVLVQTRRYLLMIRGVLWEDCTARNCNKVCKSSKDNAKKHERLVETKTKGHHFKQPHDAACSANNTSSTVLRFMSTNQKAQWKSTASKCSRTDVLVQWSGHDTHLLLILPDMPTSQHIVKWHLIFMRPEGQ